MAVRLGDPDAPAIMILEIALGIILAPILSYLTCLALVGVVYVIGAVVKIPREYNNKDLIQ